MLCAMVYLLPAVLYLLCYWENLFLLLMFNMREIHNTHTYIHLKRSKIAKSTMDVSIEWQRLCFVSIEVTVVQPNGKRAQTWIQKNEADEENCMCRSSRKKRVARKQVTNTYYTVRNGVKYCEECDLAWGDVLVAFVCAEFASGCRITVICI